MAKRTRSGLSGDQSVSNGPVEGTHDPRALNKGDGDLLRILQGHFKTWANTTTNARLQWGRDFEMTEGNGKQWSRKDRDAVSKTGRPVLEFNQILPQVELVSGMQRGLKLDYVAVPRNVEDRRLGEIATASLKAAQDFIRADRVSSQVFDDGIICGLGAWEIQHQFDDAQDLIWGDISMARINPMSFIFDPWAVDFDMQDGAFMGKASWVDFDTFKQRWPDFAHLAKPGEWLSEYKNSTVGADSFGLGPNLERELFDAETGRIRVLTMWHKVFKSINLIVDTESGQVRDVPSKNEGEKRIADIKDRVSQEAASRLNIITQDATSAIVDIQSQQPLPDAQGQPLVFASPEAAQAHLDALTDQAGLQAGERLQVISRKARVPRWAELVWWSIMDQGKTPYADRLFPYVPYVSRRFSDDPDSIMGIVRNLRDPQDEYNKRYSNILAHANSSSHSGWINRKAGGANKTELETMGSKPGVVVEFTGTAPVQIKPVEMSQGHFAMLETSERNILRISGINAELVGQTTQATVSGRAIRARQEGGTTILKPRFKAFEDAELDVARMLLSRIQQFYTPEKIKRIIGVAELNDPLGEAGSSIFADPVSGKPMPDEQIIALLSTIRNHQYDLSLKLAPSTATERQARFEQAIQLMGMITSTGREIGGNTMAALMDLADMPTRLQKGLEADAQAEQQQQVTEPGGQNDTVQGAISNIRGGRAGGEDK